MTFGINKCATFAVKPINFAKTDKLRKDFHRSLLVVTNYLKTDNYTYLGIPF